MHRHYSQLPDRLSYAFTQQDDMINGVKQHNTVRHQTRCSQWLEWSCEAGGSPDEARSEQTPYPFHTQLIWHYLGIK